VAEIERRARDRRLVQLLAPVRGGMPLGVHAGSAHRHPVTAVGWSSDHVQDAAARAQGFQSALTSLVMAGCSERGPKLRILLIGSGFAWLPARGWRLDRLWARMRDQLPELRHPPCPHLKRRGWLSTQPMEEPGDPAALMRSG